MKTNRKTYIAPVTELVASSLQAKLLAGTTIAERHSEVEGANGGSMDGVSDVVEIEDGSGGVGSRSKAWGVMDWDEEW